MSIVSQVGVKYWSHHAQGVQGHDPQRLHWTLTLPYIYPSTKKSAPPPTANPFAAPSNTSLLLLYEQQYSSSSPPKLVLPLPKLQAVDMLSPSYTLSAPHHRCLHLSLGSRAIVSDRCWRSCTPNHYITHIQPPNYSVTESHWWWISNPCTRLVVLRATKWHVWPYVWFDLVCMSRLQDRMHAGLLRILYSLYVPSTDVHITWWQVTVPTTSLNVPHHQPQLNGGLNGWPKR